MTDEEEVQVREAVDEAFQQGCVEARAGVAGDLRAVIDFFKAEVRALRREVCVLAKLPVPSLLDRDGPLN